MSVISLAELKAKFETGDIPTGSDFGDFIDTVTDLLSQSSGAATLGQALLADGAQGVMFGEVGPGYTVFRALIYQFGTADPYLGDVLENTLGFVPTYQRAAQGTYTIVGPAGAFPNHKVHLLISAWSQSRMYAISRASDTQIQIDAYNASGAFVDNNEMMVEIKVYP